MDEASRRRIVASFYDRLAPGGYLILGHSESLLREESPFVPEELPDDLVYRKPGISEPPREGSSFSRGSRP